MSNDGPGASFDDYDDLGGYVIFSELDCSPHEGLLAG
jgi:hypothetical protein